MAEKNKIEKILARKKIRLTNPRGLDEKVVGYQQAIELVRLSRRAGDYDLGNNYLRQLVAQVDEIAEPSVFLLGICLDNMLLDEAEHLVATLRARFPRDGFALRECARFHQTVGEMDKAEELLLHAVQTQPKSADNLARLAELYIAMGAGEKALNCYERALHIEPHNCDAIFGKARLLGKRASPEFAEQVSAAVKSGKFSGFKLATLQFAMAHLCADNDAHFAYLNDANRSMQASRKFDSVACAKSTENTLYRFRQSVINSLYGIVKDDAKPIFIVGMPRSGTTLLEQIIGAHPRCFPIGEDGAFATAVNAVDKLGCPPLDASSEGALEKCRNYFLNINAGFKKNRLVAAAGDKTLVTKAMGYHLLLGLIFLTMPNAKIIYVERHPLATIYSCYEQKFTAGMNFSFDLVWAAEYYKQFKLLMSHWLAVFPGKIHTVRYEDLVKNKKAEVEKILQFCDLEWSDACMAHEESVGSVLTSSDVQVRQPVHQHSVERWRKVEQHLEPAKKILDDFLNYPQ